MNLLDLIEPQHPNRPKMPIGVQGISPFDDPLIARALAAGQARPAPRMPGPVNTQKVKGPSFLDRLGGALFKAPGGTEGLLSEEDIGGARNQGLLGLGASLLADSGPKIVSEFTGFGASVGKAIQQAQSNYKGALDATMSMRAGQQDFEAKKLALTKAKGLDEGRKKIIAKNPMPPKEDVNRMRNWLDDVIPQFIEIGDEGGFAKLTQIRSTLGNADSKNITDKITEVIGPDGKLAFGYITPAGVQLIPGAAPPAQKAGSTTPKRLTTLVNPATKRPEIAEYDPTSGRFRFTGQQPGSSSQPSEMERKAQALSEMVTPMVPVLDAADTPTRIEMLARTNRLGEVLKEDMQKNDIAGRMIMDGYLRLTTGAAYNSNEMNNAHTMLIPMPGDKPGTIALKRKTRKGLIRALQRAAGRAFAPVEEDYSETDVSGNLLYEEEEGGQ